MLSTNDLRAFEIFLKALEGVNSKSQYDAEAKRFAEVAAKKKMNFDKFMENVALHIKQSGPGNANRRSWGNMDKFSKLGFDKLMIFGPEEFADIVKSGGDGVLKKYSEQFANARVSKQLKEGDKVQHPKHGVGFFNRFFNLDNKLVALVKFLNKKYGHLEMGTPVDPNSIDYISSLASTSKSGILDPFQKEMNPKIWDTSGEEPRILEDLKEKVLDKLKLFIDKYDAELFGLTFYGGNAGYQYGDGSDIDLGVYIEWPEEKIPMYEEMLDFCRGELSFLHEGIEVHFFLKDPIEKEAVEANENVYEILSDTWIQKPKRFDVDPKEELAPFIEKGSILVQKMQIIFDGLMSEIKNLKELNVEELPKSHLEAFNPLISTVKQLRVNRNIEHKNLRKKAVNKEEITFFDRATQNEVAWKLLTETKMLKKLDEIKDLLK